MPSSNLTQISTIMELVTLTNPAKLLDVGVGFGKYGVLSREYLELWAQDEDYGRKSVIIDGIEAFPGYITPVHEHIYNTIIVGDARQVIRDLGTNYDLILLIDVLEHMSR